MIGQLEFIKNRNDVSNTVLIEQEDNKINSFSANFNSEIFNESNIIITKEDKIQNYKFERSIHNIDNLNENKNEKYQINTLSESNFDKTLRELKKSDVGNMSALNLSHSK